MEVPRLGVESELRPTPQPQQHEILNPLSEARDRTHILMDTSRICSIEPQRELPFFHFVIRYLQLFLQDRIKT